MINDEIIPELMGIYGDQFGRIWWFQDGALKSKVYVTPPENMNQLRDRITEEVNQLKDDPGQIRRVVKTMRSRILLLGGQVKRLQVRQETPLC